MALWATASDIIDRWIGGDPPTDLELVETLVSDAETVISVEYPTIQERIDSGALSLARVKLVVARMTIRALRNPEGVRQRQETTGPFTGSVTYGGDTPGQMWLTNEERQMLASSGARRPRAFTINPIGPTPTSDPDWWVSE